jgi:hypothetical protein
VKAIYIDKMPNDLDQYLRAEISKRFNGTITVVLEAGRADAILTTETGNDRHYQSDGLAGGREPQDRALVRRCKRSQAPHARHRPRR